MKKLFIITAILSLALSATAQDTVSFLTRHANYFYQDGFHPDSSCAPIFYTCHEGTVGGEMAKLFVTKDTLRVIGIAAVLEKDVRSDRILDYVADTSHESANSYVRLYTPDHDSAVVRREVLFNIFYTPVSYYLDKSFSTVSGNPITTAFELMFDNPIKVFDSFYVGKTFFGTRPCGMHPSGSGWLDAHIDYAIGYLGNSPALQNHPETTLVRFMNDDFVTTYSWAKRVHQSYLLIWPIIDTVTSTEPGDTNLAIGEPELLHRLTAVTPNPATGRAKVVSSFGLTLVEAFNAAGEKVHELRLPDAPLTATLDVSRWPTGTYILRLHTPQGVAAKKLVVSR